MKKDLKLLKFVNNKKYNELLTLTNKRLIICQSLGILFFVFLILHIFMLQVLDVKGYKERGIRQRTATLQEKRGDILDRNGLKMATNETVYEIYAHPRDYIAKRPIKTLAKILLPYMTISEQELIKKLSNNKFSVITLRKDVNRETAQKVAALELREISVRAKDKRVYPQGDMAAHLLGYYNQDSNYSMGIENIAAEKLDYIKSKQNYEISSMGDLIYNISLKPEDILTGTKGENVTLTIDSAVQHICEKELKKTINEKKAERGTIIVINPKNGEILGWATFPHFNPNYYWKSSSEQMKNWALTDVYPPGSTFKIITIASALELGKINENSLIEDSGKIEIGSWKIKNNDFNANPNPGLINLVYLFQHSSNVGSINVAFKMKPREFYSMIKKFGFGVKTAVDLPAESSGILPLPAFWDKSRHASMGYGYGASVTAIQMISAISAIANKGVWVTPHVIKYSQEDSLKKIQKRQVLSTTTADTVTKLLAQSVANGNTSLNMKEYTVAAKTGTSRKPKENSKGYSSNVFTSAIGYLPASDPQIAIYVVIDSPKTGSDYGGTIASPVFATVAEQTTRILNIKADK